MWFPPDPGPHETAQKRFALWTADQGKSGSAPSVLAPLSCDSCGRTLAKEFDTNFLAGASVLAVLQQEDLTRWAAVHGHILLNSCSSFLRCLGCPPNLDSSGLKLLGNSRPYSDIQVSDSVGWFWVLVLDALPRILPSLRDGPDGFPREGGPRPLKLGLPSGRACTLARFRHHSVLAPPSLFSP